MNNIRRLMVKKLKQTESNAGRYLQSTHMLVEFTYSCLVLCLARFKHSFCLELSLYLRLMLAKSEIPNTDSGYVWAGMIVITVGLGA